MEQVNPSQNDPERFVDAGVLADRRARRAELAEAEIRTRLAGAEQRVAELEQLADQSSRLRLELEQRKARELQIAGLLGEAADAVHAASELVDREIKAREAAEAALRAERIAREAADQTVIAERAARDAATAAIVSARVSSAEAARSGRMAPAATPVAKPASATTPETEALVAGLAKAAERLRAQTPPPADGVAPESNRSGEQTTAPSAAAIPGRRGGGGLVGRAARTLRKLRSERP
ncbi:MAG: hypothetical protein WCK97_03045 [Actinomycetes bacterium]